ncbi:TPA: AbgT family transporter [Staphylococcus aureus]
MTSKHQQKGSIVNRFLNSVEKIGNKLPDPSVLFFLMCVGLAIMTWVISLFNVSVKHPGTHQTIYIKNIISHDGFTMIMNDTIKNFSEFPALGLVLAMMIGIGVAEKTGYFDKLMISVVNRAPRFLILPTIILIGILGSTAGDAATIILPPLAAMLFIKIGYHPIAGLTMAYASAVGGFAANIVVGMNWYFIAVSVVVLLPTILLVTTKLIIPRLGQYDDRLMHDDHEETSSHITDKEAHALKWANISFIVTIILLIITAIPEHSFLRNAKTGSLLDDAPLINGVGLIILVVFLVPGLVYGILSKEIKNTKDLGKMFGDAVGSMGTFIVIVFFAAQLLAYLKWSNLGIIAAVKGAKLLEHQNGIVLILGIIVLSAMVNMLIGSASAKWGILGPIFVPMLILIGFHPAFTQVIYRVGDSITNPITPMMPYLPLLLTYAQKYDKRMKLGALLSSLMPYSIALSIAWTVFVIIWFLLGIPVGPGGPIFVK